MNCYKDKSTFIFTLFVSSIKYKIINYFKNKNDGNLYYLVIK